MLSGFFVTQAISWYWSPEVPSKSHAMVKHEMSTVTITVWGINTIRLHWLKSLQRGQTRDIIPTVHVQSMSRTNPWIRESFLQFTCKSCKSALWKWKKVRKPLIVILAIPSFPDPLQPLFVCCAEDWLLLYAGGKATIPFKGRACNSAKARKVHDLKNPSARGVSLMDQWRSGDLCVGFFLVLLVETGISNLAYILAIPCVAICSVPTKVVTCHPSWKGKISGGLMTLLGPDAPSSLAWCVRVFFFEA